MQYTILDNGTALYYVRGPGATDLPDLRIQYLNTFGYERDDTAHFVQWLIDEHGYVVVEGEHGG